MMQTEVPTYGSELRRIRIERRYSLKDLAGVLGVTSAYISSIERGVKNPLPSDATFKLLKFMKREGELSHLMELEAHHQQNVEITLEHKKKEVVDTLVLLRNKDHEGAITYEDWLKIREILEGVPNDTNIESKRPKRL